ncbi:MAG: hypothetical protein H6Q72_1396 [Firmicutes bacterium]|nr:hypothetical protein [Bacillota bacterium]
MVHKCLVCNYDGLHDEPYDAKGVASDEICPCCGFHYGYDDDGMDKSIYIIWRLKWIEKGCTWFSKSRLHVVGWNAKEQLKGIGDC